MTEMMNDIAPNDSVSRPIRKSRSINPELPSVSLKPSSNVLPSASIFLGRRTIIAIDVATVITKKNKRSMLSTVFEILHLKIPRILSVYIKKKKRVEARTTKLSTNSMLKTTKLNRTSEAVLFPRRKPS